MSGKLELDFEIGDAITKVCLIESYKLLKKDNRELIKQYGNEHSMPKTDLANYQENTKMLYHMKEVIHYYGGKV